MLAAVATEKTGFRLRRRQIQSGFLLGLAQRLLENWRLAFTVRLTSYCPPPPLAPIALAQQLIGRSAALSSPSNSLVA